MSEMIDPHDFIGLVVVSGGVMIAVIAIIASHWRRLRVAEIEASLKQQMLDKGMPAAEIEQVIKASGKGKNMTCDNPTGDAALDKAKLVQQMVDNGYKAEEIERVLQAYQHSQPPAMEKRCWNFR